MYYCLSDLITHYHLARYVGMLGVVNALGRPGAKVDGDDIWLRGPGGKAIYFVHGDAPLPPDVDVVAAIESNGG